MLERICMLKNSYRLIYGELASSYNYVIFAVDDIFTNVIQAPMEEVYGPHKGICLKINLIWSHSIRVSLSVYKLFSWPLHIYVGGSMPYVNEGSIYLSIYLSLINEKES